jgi:hypothetical protein
MRYVLLATALLFVSPIAAAAVEDFKFIKLEQDVRNLERQVHGLSRQIAQLQRRLERPGDRPVSEAPHAAAQAPPMTSTAWLEKANWDRLRAGMNELDVIRTLGPPTSMRTQNGMRVLLYAMEIGSSAFLSGSVSMRDRTVVEIDEPVLK